ncbi:hypothetical protein GCM10027423_60630 [Spirosoma arcticum]
MVAVRRRPGLTHQECLNYVEIVHGDIARKEPAGVVRYAQSHVFDSAFGSKADMTYGQFFGRDFITELFFNSPEDMVSNAATPYVREVVMPDGRLFNNFEALILSTMAETEVPVANPGPGKVKVIHYLKKAESVTEDAYNQCWADAHASILARQPDMVAGLRKYIQSRPIPTPGEASTHFGVAKGPFYEGVASMWFDDESALPVFRAYETELSRINAEDGPPFIDFSQSFFLYTHEKTIFEVS